MSDYNDGKIHGWNGGDCPVHPNTKVRAWLHCGLTLEVRAGDRKWRHRHVSADIIAFQVVEVHAEPKTIWVNEYSDGTMAAHRTEDSAKKHAGHNATRIAVKYVEARDE
jgi:hypothetical protein